MDTSTIEQIKVALTPVAEKIGQGAQYGWEAVIKQQYVFAVQYCIAALMLFICAGVAVGFARYFYGRYKENQYQDWAFGVGLMTVLAIITTAIGLAYIGSAAGRFLNPPYYALEFFIQLTK